jgi:hypothetical protein
VLDGNNLKFKNDISFSESSFCCFISENVLMCLCFILLLCFLCIIEETLPLWSKFVLQLESLWKGNTVFSAAVVTVWLSWNLIPRKFGLVAHNLACIKWTSRLNLDQGASYPDWSFHTFHQPLQANVRTVLLSRSRPSFSMSLPTYGGLPSPLSNECQGLFPWG